jgi:hypothetical protein
MYSPPVRPCGLQFRYHPVGGSTAVSKRVVSGAEGDAPEMEKLIAGKGNGNKSSRRANVENAVLVYV